MGIVGNFCDRLCAEHPELARAVLDRPMSRLSEWIDWDAEGRPCGCLIGTIALAAGCDLCDTDRAAWGRLCNVLGQQQGDIFAVGLRVNDISTRIAHGTLVFFQGTPESDALVIRMIRDRIALNLLTTRYLGDPRPDSLSVGQYNAQVRAKYAGVEG